MDKTVQMEVIAIVGVLSAMALYVGQTEMASLGIGGLVGFLSAEQLRQGEVVIPE